MLLVCMSEEIRYRLAKDSQYLVIDFSAIDVDY